MDEKDNTILLVDKYRPKTLDDIVLNHETKRYFKNLLDQHKMVNCTFQGICGSGKTSTALLLANALNASILFVRCAIEGTIDTIRNKIKPFCETVPMEGNIKIVILDEVDAASKNGDSNFQSSLRNLIEEFESDTRFILTCNNQTVLPAVTSRCPIINLDFDTKDLILRIKYILDNEKISYTKESLSEFVKKAIKYSPDIRRIIGYLELCTSSGTLEVSEITMSDSEKTDFVKELVENAISDKDILETRAFYIQNKTKISDYVVFSSDVMNFLLDGKYIHDKDEIIALTESIYELNLVIDKEVGFFKFLTLLKKHGRN